MECPYIPDLSYNGFRERLNSAISGQRYPLSGSLELTYRCNIHCKHCYLSYAHTGIPEQDELSTQEVERIIDEIVDAGTLYLLITGGEPLMRRDFEEIYQYAKSKGLLITLFTNGTMLTPQVVDMLAEYRPFNVEITLYGFTQKTYENVTGVQGSHARCYQGIDLLLDRGIKLGLKAMVLSINQQEIQQIKQFSEERGLSFRYDPFVNSGLDGDRNPLSLRIKTDDIVRMDLQDPARVENIISYFDSRKKIESTQPALGNSGDNGYYLYTCGAGLKSYHIDPYGQLSICMTARHPHYDMRNGTFKQGWDEFIPEVRGQKVHGENFCSSCEIRSLCSQCPGWSQLEHGDSQTRVNYLCEATHKRAMAFGIIENIPF